MFLGTLQSRYNVIFALAYSVCAALLLILLHPLTLNAWDCGANPCIDLLEEVMFALWNLSTRAITTSCLMLWAYVSSVNLLDGLEPEQYDSALHWRLLVTWALLLTFAGAAITVRLMTWREALTDGDDDDDDDPFAEPRTPQRQEREGGANQWSRLHADEAGAPSFSTTDLFNEAYERRPQSAVEARRGHGCCGCNRPDGRRRALRAAGVQVLLLGEKVLAWMAGCAWTTVFFPSTMPFPSVEQTLSALGVAILLTISALAALTLAGGTLEVEKTSEDTVERHVVESYFMVNSASFFVGWSWIVVLRDLLALSGQVAVSDTRMSALGRVASFFGLEREKDVRDAETMSFVRALAGVLLFGPVLSVLVVWAKGAALRAYGRAGGRRVTLRLLALVTLATRRMQNKGDSSPARRKRLDLTRQESNNNLALHVGLTDDEEPERHPRSNHSALPTPNVSRQDSALPTPTVSRQSSDLTTLH